MLPLLTKTVRHTNSTSDSLLPGRAHVLGGRRAPGLAIAVAIAAARVPLSGYTPFGTDSQFFFAVKSLEGRAGVDSASLVVAVLTTVAAAGAVAFAFRGVELLPLMLTLFATTVVTVVAVHVDLVDTTRVRSDLPRNRLWVDDAADGPVTVIATPVSSRTDLFNALYWNVSIQREKVLDRAVPSDAFSAPKLQVGRDGSLRNVRGEFLFDEYGTTGSFLQAERVASVRPFTLWRPRGTPRFRILIEGRFFDHWLSPFGRIRVWPVRGNASTDLSFRLSLPSDWSKTGHVKLGGATFTVKPGAHADVACRGESGILDTRFSSNDIIVQPDFRRFTVRLTDIRLTDVDRGSFAVSSSRPAICRRVAPS